MQTFSNTVMSEHQILYLSESIIYNALGDGVFLNITYKSSFTMWINFLLQLFENCLNVTHIFLCLPPALKLTQHSTANKG